MPTPVHNAAAPDKETGFSWGRFFECRTEVRKRFPSVYKLEIKKKRSDIVMEGLKETGTGKILDVGASDRGLAEKVKKVYPSVVYKSMDVDRAGAHDYYSLDEVDDKFDVAVLSEVIEHLSFDDGMELLGKIRGVLVPGGRIVVSTPNMHHPNRWWMDSDHRTAYSYEVLGAALLAAGFEVEKIYRVYNDQFLKRLIRLYITAPLHRYLDVDFAKSVVVVGVRPGKP
ncbi:MAG: methyltransferase domain-containing protein [Thermodesulfobacteriota bacterium]